MKQDSNPKTPDAKPNPPSPKWVKDAEGIAKAWGLKLYEQRKMMVKQLDAVRAAMLTPGFPVKVKGKGYDRASVMAFAMERVEMHQSQRKFVVIEKAARSGVSGLGSGAERTALRAIPTSGELPEQSFPADESELFAGMTGPEMRKGRLDRLQDMYLRPAAYETKIAKFEIEELKAERPHIFAKESPATTGGSDGENITGTLRGVAGWIKVNYPGCNPTHTDIKNWKAGAHLPYGCKENFPAWDDSGNRHKTSEVRSWVERYLVKRATGQSALPMDMDYRQAQEKLDYERSQEEFRVWQQANSEKYILRETAEASVVGALKLHHVLTKRHCEKLFRARVVEKLTQFNATLSVELLTQIGEVCAAVGREIISAIEVDCEKA